MGVTDFIIAICADKIKILSFGAGEKCFHELQTGGIRPLHVIDKQGQGVFCGGKYLKKFFKHHLKTVLGFCW